MVDLAGLGASVVILLSVPKENADFSGGLLASPKTGTDESRSVFAFGSDVVGNVGFSGGFSDFPDVLPKENPEEGSSKEVPNRGVTLVVTGAAVVGAVPITSMGGFVSDFPPVGFESLKVEEGAKLNVEEVVGLNKDLAAAGFPSGDLTAVVGEGEENENELALEVEGIENENALDEVLLSALLSLSFLVMGVDDALPNKGALKLNLASPVVPKLKEELTSSGVLNPDLLLYKFKLKH